MPIDSDPYTVVIEGLWSLLEAREDFTELVKLGNRIKFMGKNREPVKAQIQTGDVPEVRIIVRGSTPHPIRTSNSSTDTVIFELQASSGDQRLDAYHNPLRWACFRAFAHVYDALKNLTWKDKTFVKNAKPTAVTDGVSQQDLDRGIKGWSAIWAVEVDLWFDTSDL